MSPPDTTGQPQLEQILEQFEAAWRADAQPPDIADFSRELPTESLLELVLVDMEYRWQQTQVTQADALGDRPTWWAYAATLDQLGSIRDVPDWAVAESYRIVRSCGHPLSIADFQRGYPDRDLVDLLQRIESELEFERDTTELAAAAAAEADPTDERTRRPLSLPHAPLPFGDYLLKQLIGSGGSGRVYRARQLSLQRDVALKALRKSRQLDSAAVQQFVHEAQILGRFRHSAIIGIHGLGQFPAGGYFLVMDLIDGPDLQQCIDRQQLSLKEALQVTQQTLAAIMHAHARGVWHCDLKPSNVLLAERQQVVVTDFGMARLAEAYLAGFDRLEAYPTDDRLRQPALTGGTPAYMAPEQLGASLSITGLSVGPATDVFGLGGLLYAMLSGLPPRAVPANCAVLTLRSLQDMLRRPVDDVRRHAPDVPAPVATLIADCLSLAPENRPDAAQLHQRLESVIGR